MKHTTIVTLTILAATALQAHSQVAVTELMADPDSLFDAKGEYIELYNYSQAPVQIENWVLADEDSNSVSLPKLTLKSGSFLLLTRNKQPIEEEWFAGKNRDQVIELGFGTLANSTDEIVLKDAEGKIVWHLAYGDDGSNGVATYLTSTDFNVTTFGSKSLPGILRSGDDNGKTDFLGYEKAAFETHQTVESKGGDLGSPLAGHYKKPVQEAALNQ